MTDAMEAQDATVTERVGRWNELAIRWSERVHAFHTAAAPSEPPPPKRLEELVSAANQCAVGAAREFDRMGRRPVSTELEARACELGIGLEHLGLTIGTVLHDIDLRELSTDEVRFVRDALLERKVVFFRDQNLTEEEQVTCGRWFGTLDAFPFGHPGENPYVLEIVHGDQSPGTENSWHTDVAWMERPSLGSIAQLVAAPPHGGDTLFSDSYAAYLGLPAPLRERIDGLHAVCDYRHMLQGRGTAALPRDMADELAEAFAFGVSHPLVRTHPETGRPTLYLTGVLERPGSLHDPETGEQLTPGESAAISAELNEQHARPEYQSRFSWTPGAVAFWDNRAVQHYAVSDYYPARRVPRRVTISGDRPIRDRDREAEVAEREALAR